MNQNTMKYKAEIEGIDTGIIKASKMEMDEKFVFWYDRLNKIVAAAARRCLLSVKVVG